MVSCFRAGVSWRNVRAGSRRGRGDGEVRGHQRAPGGVIRGMMGGSSKRFTEKKKEELGTV